MRSSSAHSVVPAAATLFGSMPICAHLAPRIIKFAERRLIIAEFVPVGGGVLVFKDAVVVTCFGKPEVAVEDVEVEAIERSCNSHVQELV